MSVEGFFREAKERLAALENELHHALSQRFDLARSMMEALDLLELLQQ